MPPAGEKRFWSATKYHLTYKDHIDFDVLKDLIKDKCGAWTALSIVHENGDVDEQDPMPYAHTHVAFMLAKKMDSTDCRLLDVGDIHPHVKNRTSIKWIQYLFEMYHKGHKVKKDGKKYFIDPVKIWQSEVPQTWTSGRLLLDAVAAAPSAMDAFEIAEVSVKSIGDVLSVRRECQRKRKHKHEWDEDCDKKRFKTIEWDKKKAFVLLGPSQCGKTSWAAAQFENPVMVGELNELRGMSWEGVDGIVFDEADFANFKRKTQIFMLDMKYTRTIKVADYTITIPKGMPRIFCNNQRCFSELTEINNRFECKDTRGDVDPKTGKPTYFYFE